MKITKLETFRLLEFPNILWVRVHGEDGLGDLDWPKSSRRPDPRHAVELLRDVIRASAEPVTLVTLAPLTNVALLLRTYPHIAAQLRDLSLEIYARAAPIAEERGLILADTKFEFGLDDAGVMTLADEVLTSDSSRYWDAAAWQTSTTPAERMASFDKQIVRDWLLSPESGWDRSSGAAPPPLPPAVVEHTRSRYVEAYERLTGSQW